MQSLLGMPAMYAYDQAKAKPIRTPIESPSNSNMWLTRREPSLRLIRPTSFKANQKSRKSNVAVVSETLSHRNKITTKNTAHAPWPTATMNPRSTHIRAELDLGNVSAINGTTAERVGTSSSIQT